MGYLGIRAHVLYKLVSSPRYRPEAPDFYEDAQLEKFDHFPENTSDDLNASRDSEDSFSSQLTSRTDLRYQRDELRLRSNLLKSDLELTESRIKFLEEDLKSRQAIEQQHRTIKKSLDTEIDKLHQEKYALQDEIQELNSTILKLQARMEAVISEKCTVVTPSQRLEKTRSQEEISGLKRENATLSQELNDVKSKLDAAQKEIRKAVSALAHEKKQIEKTHADLKNRLSLSEQALNHEQMISQEQSRFISQLQSQIANYRAQIDTQKQEVDTLAHALIFLREKLLLMKEQSSKKKSQFIEFVETINRALREIDFTEAPAPVALSTQDNLYEAFPVNLLARRPLPSRPSSEFE